MVLYLCVLIVFSLHRESLELILVDESLPEVVLSQKVMHSVRGFLRVTEDTGSVIVLNGSILFLPKP
jgi:hypothetical protein